MRSAGLAPLSRLGPDHAAARGRHAPGLTNLPRPSCSPYLFVPHPLGGVGKNKQVRERNKNKNKREQTRGEKPETIGRTRQAANKNANKNEQTEGPRAQTANKPRTNRPDPPPLDHPPEQRRSRPWSPLRGGMATNAAQVDELHSACALACFFYRPQGPPRPECSFPPTDQTGDLIDAACFFCATWAHPDQHFRFIHSPRGRPPTSCTPMSAE